LRALRGAFFLSFFFIFYIRGNLRDRFFFFELQMGKLEIRNKEINKYKALIRNAFFRNKALVGGGGRGGRVHPRNRSLAEEIRR